MFLSEFLSWVTLSLQLVGIFFLISLILLVLGKYVLQMRNLPNKGGFNHVNQEFTSVRVIRQKKLNIEHSGKQANYG